MFDYCQTYQKANKKIDSRLLNNNKMHNKQKYCKVLYEHVTLEKLLETYTCLIAIQDRKKISSKFIFLRNYY